MSAPLKFGMGLFYVLATLLMVQQFGLTQERSFRTISQWALMYLGSVVWPILWTRYVIRRLRSQGVPLDDGLQFSLFMPAWFAAISALMALSLTHR